MLGIEYPVIQGGMAWIADAKLAAAVSFVCMTAMTVFLMFTSGVFSPFTILPIIAHGKQLIAQIITDVIALIFARPPITPASITLHST